MKLTIDTTRTMIDAFPGNHVLTDGKRVVAICPLVGTDSAAGTIQHAVNLHDELVDALRGAIVLIGHPDDAVTKALVEVLAKAEAP